MKGNINWVYISASHSTHLINVKDDKKPYNFAISQNSHYSSGDDPNKIIYKSSGMTWASCIVSMRHRKKILFIVYIYILLIIYLWIEPSSIEDIYIKNITDTSIEIHWIFECTDKILNVYGYLVSYCTLANKYSYNCQGMKSIFINLLQF